MVPASLVTPFRGDPRALAAWAEPFILVVEIWSPSTGGCDQAPKLAAYRKRGNQEIWYIHPYERTLTAWRREADGNYQQSEYSGGIIPLEAVPSVTIDLDDLLA